MVEGRRAAEFVDRPEAVLEWLRGVVEELQLVGGASGAALGTGPVVGDQHDQGVFELAGLLQEVEQPSDLMVGVRQEPGEHLHHPGGEPAGLG